ncbi:DUF4269 domain-containing protein [Pollutibacter soli]|uniref:DUF4269 domain-containing protein n=1 Tax=Pollutibacter soli TaxID=3034157 RepID=UPI0030132649
MPVINFEDPQYLLKGTAKQVLAHKTLAELRIFDLLNEYDPVLAGTIPIGIDIEGSDLDILCCFSSAIKFEIDLKLFFAKQEKFRVRKLWMDGIETVIASFKTNHFPVEIFGQETPVVQQAGYLHLINEYGLLIKYGEDFRRKIIDLKLAGWKTEPAFAKLLGLSGDPYQAMLKIAHPL